MTLVVEPTKLIFLSLRGIGLDDVEVVLFGFIGVLVEWPWLTLVNRVQRWMESAR